MQVLVWPGYLVTLGLLAAYGAHRLFLVVQLLRCRRSSAPAGELSGQAPVVTVQLPIFNERYVVGRLIDAVADLDWPREHLEIQVLDDSTDATVELCRQRVAALRARGYDAHHLHRCDRIGFKAGALQAGLEVARGEFILVLDADFVPRRDFLRRAINAFDDPSVAMVQARWGHLNRSASSLTEVQALLLDGHFVVEQQVRAATGRFFNFNGTAGLWRAAAIQSAGGWQGDTLTEDLDLSYRALLRGWRFRYCVGLVAPAELPCDMRAFKSQQFRWAKGSIQVARKLLPAVLRAPVPLATKVEAIFHLTQNVPYLLTLLLALLFVPVAISMEGDLPDWLHIALIAATTGTLASYCAASQSVLGGWRGCVVGLARLPGMIAITAGISVSQARAVVEGLVGVQSSFVRTPKRGLVGGRRGWRRLDYRGRAGLLPAIEVLLGGCLAAVAVYSWRADHLWALPIATLFASGYLYVGLASAFRH